MSRTSESAAQKHREIYGKLYDTLRENSSKPVHVDEGLTEFRRKYCPREGITDDEYHWIMVYVSFYSGMRASTVNAKFPVIEKYLRGYERVASYGYGLGPQAES